MKNNQPVDESQLYSIIFDSTDGLFAELSNPTSDDLPREVFLRIENSSRMKELTSSKNELPKNILELNDTFKRRIIASIGDQEPNAVTHLCNQYLTDLTKILNNM